MSQPLIMSSRPEAAEMCLAGRKTMTRRIYEPEKKIALYMEETDNHIGDAHVVYSRDGNGDVRAIWRIGESIAIKPKRTACAIGRVMCTGLRIEHVQDITEQDAKREGVDPVSSFAPDGLGRGGEFEYRSFRSGFEAVWRRLNKRGPTSWESNPLVVVIEFEPLKEDLTCASSL